MPWFSSAHVQLLWALHGAGTRMMKWLPHSPVLVSPSAQRLLQQAGGCVPPELCNYRHISGEGAGVTLAPGDHLQLGCEECEYQRGELQRTSRGCQGLLPLSRWSEWSPCGPCLQDCPRGALARGPSWPLLHLGPHAGFRAAPLPPLFGPRDGEAMGRGSRPLHCATQPAASLPRPWSLPRFMPVESLGGLEPLPGTLQWGVPAALEEAARGHGLRLRAATWGLAQERAARPGTPCPPWTVPTTAREAVPTSGPACSVCRDGATQVAGRRLGHEL